MMLFFQTDLFGFAYTGSPAPWYDFLSDDVELQCSPCYRFATKIFGP